jgi:3-methyladenine DNA glycosylase AlkD
MKVKLIAEIKSLGSTEKAKAVSRFFKTGKGEYGDGDKFLGVTVPEVRGLIRPYLNIDLKDLKLLLVNSWHEIRLAGCLILVHKYQKASSEVEQEKLVGLYLKCRKGINNWDLVDQTAYKIIGEHCVRSGKTTALYQMIESNHHWDRRIAMVATMAFIRKNQFGIVTDFAKKILKDDEDLMHKAAGWMLREMGKKDQKLLLKFVQKYGSQMPRTMLRYAIEKFPQKQRSLILGNSKIKKT